MRALAKHGAGKVVAADQALPGDLVQIWRSSGNGHAAVFLELQGKGRTRILRYFSVNRAGIGLHEESVGIGGASIDLDKSYFVRAFQPNCL